MKNFKNLLVLLIGLPALILGINSCKDDAVARGVGGVSIQIYSKRTSP